MRYSYITPAPPPPRLHSATDERNGRTIILVPALSEGKRVHVVPPDHPTVPADAARLFRAVPVDAPATAILTQSIAYGTETGTQVGIFLRINSTEHPGVPMAYLGWVNGSCVGGRLFHGEDWPFRRIGILAFTQWLAAMGWKAGPRPAKPRPPIVRGACPACGRTGLQITKAGTPRQHRCEPKEES